jgi:hypothetical protein
MPNLFRGQHQAIAIVDSKAMMGQLGKPVQAAERGGRKAKASKAEADTAGVRTNPAAAENASGQGGSRCRCPLSIDALTTEVAEWRSGLHCCSHETGYSETKAITS